MPFVLILISIIVAPFAADDPATKNAAPQRPAPNQEFRAAYVEIGTQLMDQRKKWLDEKDQQKKDQIMKDMILLRGLIIRASHTPY